MNIESFTGQFGVAESENKYPVQLWNPPLSGDMNLVIKKDGSWWHEGGKFTRESLVLLFSSILKREGDEYYLVSPVEKWRIQVEDTPLQIISASEVDGGVMLVTSERRSIPLDAEHLLKFSQVDGVSIPYIHIRDGLDARFSRNAYYSLAALANEFDDELILDSFGHRQILMA